MGVKCFFLLVVAVLCIFTISAANVEHNARLEEIISRKTAEAKAAHGHVAYVLNKAKERAESAASRPVVGKLHDSATPIAAHNELMSSVVLPERKEKAPVSQTHATLAAHGVSTALVKEINNMATSYIPREDIIKHVRTHFPNKQPHEWNDIVISAISSQNKAQPESLETNRADKNDATLQKRRFNQAKDGLENRLNA